ncbi:hypothetical protein CEK25_002881 [Fusarium fujikuroi]|nr:hypothetical protein CEK25_002881 [Fusarium fujikuroi]
MRPWVQIDNPSQRSFRLSLAEVSQRESFQKMRYLHGHGVIHAALPSRNILTGVIQVKATPGTHPHLKQAEGDTPDLRDKPGKQSDSASASLRKDGKLIDWAPSYLLEPRPLSDLGSRSMTGLKDITPFALAFTEKIHDERGAKAIALRAPGRLFDEMGKGRRMAFGCLLFEGDDHGQTSVRRNPIPLGEVMRLLPEHLIQM